MTDGMEYARRMSAKMRAKHPERHRARSLLGIAIESGRIKRQPCERCGLKGDCRNAIHGHHEDYSKPLDVIWLCSRCHGARHRELSGYAAHARRVGELKMAGKTMREIADEVGVSVSFVRTALTTPYPETAHAMVSRLPVHDEIALARVLVTGRAA